MAEFIAAQGGSPEVVENPNLLPQAGTRIAIPSEKAGTVRRVNALNVGVAAKILGAGRKANDDYLNHSIGIILEKKVGDRVEKGEPLAVFLSDGDPEKIDPAQAAVLGAYEIGAQPVEPSRLCYAVVTADGIEVV